MVTDLVVLGVPSSAGAHHAGHDLAPAALRAHGLVDRLRAAGFAVTDAGDVAGAVFRPDDLDTSARNVDAVVRVALGVLLGAPQVSALVLTEVNPTHDPGGEQLERYVDAVVHAVTAGLGPAG